MHRLTCNDADRLAADLERAAVMLHELAAIHARYGTGMSVTGDHRWAEHHTRTSESVRDTARQLQDYVKRLRARTELWTRASRPTQDRARVPDQFSADAKRRRRARRVAA